MNHVWPPSELATLAYAVAATPSKRLLLDTVKTSNDVDVDSTMEKLRPRELASNARPESGRTAMAAEAGSATLEILREGVTAKRGKPVVRFAVKSCTKMLTRAEPPGETESARESSVGEYRPAPHAGSESMMEKAMP